MFVLQEDWLVMSFTETVKLIYLYFNGNVLLNPILSFM